MNEVLLENPSNGVMLVRINRPEVRNALNAAVRTQINDAFRSFDTDPGVRAVVLTSVGDHFAAGGDLREFGASSMVDRITAEYTDGIARCRKPVITAVNGYALGGGCEYAMNGDIIIAGQDAILGQPEVKVGLVPGLGGTQYLPRAIGLYPAMLMLLTGEPITAERAATLGLVSEVVEGRAEERALEIAKKIARLAPLTVQAIKRVVRNGTEVSLSTALEMEKMAHQQMFATEDMREGAKAFFDKRYPTFSGR
ncbi:enoyl-CoA hydratase/isomerase family protein (plasmid) [Rhodococcus sp. USK10]|uniref:enoyl-CoA hydratase-related protein n=1 Tax=Rhodococcus sp. USK10 TaxID=2789739 RepID=UPI001C5FAE07|nr:enoyl-CoA hydratase-related protein [Rhodococcus sp. USK10]QYB00170.1 enoyl-CoA hydratase/isomerase family protein [Rhodococcus sp. USK10]